MAQAFRSQMGYSHFLHHLFPFYRDSVHRSVIDSEVLISKLEEDLLRACVWFVQSRSRLRVTWKRVYSTLWRALLLQESLNPRAPWKIDEWWIVDVGIEVEDAILLELYVLETAEDMSHSYE